MILIVDDRPDGAEALCKVIARYSYPCTWAASGIEALAMIRASPAGRPLLVVLDEEMPDLNGLAVVRRLRSDPATAEVPVIMFTAGLNLSKREPAMSLGVLQWMIKGTDTTTVAAQILAHYHRVGGVQDASGVSPHPLNQRA
jgi:DNA-binding response OmpR family regulator